MKYAYKNKCHKQTQSLHLPVQSQCMQEGWQAFHNEKNGNCENSKEVKDYGQKYEASEASARKANVHHHGPQHLRQLCARDKEGVQISMLWTWESACISQCKYRFAE